MPVDNFARSAAADRQHAGAALYADTHDAAAAIVRTDIVDATAAAAKRVVDDAAGDDAPALDLDMTGAIARGLDKQAPNIDTIAGIAAGTVLDVYNALADEVSADDVAEAARVLALVIGFARDNLNALRPVFRVVAQTLGEIVGRAAAVVVKAAIAAAVTAPEGGAGGAAIGVADVGKAAVGIAANTARRAPAAISETAKNLFDLYAGVAINAAVAAARLQTAAQLAASRQTTARAVNVRSPLAQTWTTGSTMRPRFSSRAAAATSTTTTSPRRPRRRAPPSGAH